VTASFCPAIPPEGQLGSDYCCKRNYTNDQNSGATWIRKLQFSNGAEGIANEVCEAVSDGGF